VQIRFVNFWKTFNENDNFFMKYLDYFGYNPKLVQDKRSAVDLEIHSVFYNKSLRKLVGLDKKLKSRSYFNSKRIQKMSEFVISQKTVATKRIWFTGENIRPPYDQLFDRYLSFDQFNFNDNNFYFPLWYTHLDWFGEPEYNSRVGIHISMSTLAEKRKLTRTKKKFACIFLSNPHPFRLEMVKKLRENFEVDVFGSYSGNPVAHKIDVSKDYMYTICFENDLYPGYITEKILEAYVSETVPIYWGDFGNDVSFNPDSFFNLSSFESFEHLVEKIKSCDYEKIYEQPLLNHEVDFTLFHNFMSKFLKH